MEVTELVLYNGREQLIVWYYPDHSSPKEIRPKYLSRKGNDCKPATMQTKRTIKGGWQQRNHGRRRILHLVKRGKLPGLQKAAIGYLCVGLCTSYGFGNKDMTVWKKEQKTKRKVLRSRKETLSAGFFPSSTKNDWQHIVNEIRLASVSYVGVCRCLYRWKLSNAAVTMK